MMKIWLMNKRFVLLGFLFIFPILVFGQLKSETSQSMIDVRFSDETAENIINYEVNSVKVSPIGALLRSVVLPGWGHYYVTKSHQTRGLLHLGSDLALIGAYFGISVHANKLEQNLQTFAGHHAGINLKNKNRDYLLSVAEFNSIQAYNDYQERSRNWDKIYEVNSSNYWSWDNEQNRLSFLKMDTKVQDNHQQLPAVISLMVVNRIISGISAFTLARNQSVTTNSISLSLPPTTSSNEFGIVANYTIQF